MSSSRNPEVANHVHHLQSPSRSSNRHLTFPIFSFNRPSFVTTPFDSVFPSPSPSSLKASIAINAAIKG
ncbi:hypothetical protein CsatA_026549 [Cannabis sativa]